MSHSDSLVPEDIREALLENAKNWLLANYTGNRKGLSSWSDHYARLVSVKSFDFPGNRAKALRRLVKLSKQGVLIEQPRPSSRSARSFTLPRPQLDEIGREAIRYWESKGYVVGQIMNSITTEEGNT